MFLRLLNLANVISGSTIEYSAETALLPDGYLALADIMVAQTVALLTSIKVGNKPDTPSPTGTVNRVVGRRNDL